MIYKDCENVKRYRSHFTTTKSTEYFASGDTKSRNLFSKVMAFSLLGNPACS